MEKVTGEWGKIFSDKLTEIGKTAYWLSKQTKLPYNSINRYLTGAVQPPADRFLLICKTLNITL